MPITLLLVDDSEIIRFLFSKSLERDPELRVVGIAKNGLEAIEQARKLKPDLVLLDIDMPEMSGLAALPKIRAASRRSKVFMVTAGTPNNAIASFTALGLGASEFILKPQPGESRKPAEFIDELREKIKAVCATQPKCIDPVAPLPRPPEIEVQAERVLTPTPIKKLAPITAMKRGDLAEPMPEIRVESFSLQPGKAQQIHALAIASSTGGPEALVRIFSDLNGNLSHIPIFITQHMPPIFTTAFANHIRMHVNRPCKEAEHDETVTPGMVYLAPGGFHMLVKKQGERVVIKLSEHAPVNSCRPSADPMFASISDVYGENMLALVLTGIGNDGANGGRTVFDNGGSVIAQDRASSVVYGMPKCVAALGVCEAILPLNEISDQLLRRCSTLH